MVRIFSKSLQFLDTKYNYTNVMLKRAADAFVHSWHSMNIGALLQQALLTAKGITARNKFQISDIKCQLPVYIIGIPINTTEHNNDT